MNIGVVVFPGSNCDQDLFRALKKFNPKSLKMLWHKDPDLPKGLDLCALPGGFSYGDYLRTGAIAAQSPIIRSILDFAARGGFILGICNGFQILCECGLLPGVLLKNSSTRFVCKNQSLEVCDNTSLFTKLYANKVQVTFPIAHHDGNFFADSDTYAKICDNSQIAFKYKGDNPNGSMGRIAGLFSEDKRVLGLMPHPERCLTSESGRTDGALFFESICKA